MERSGMARMPGTKKRPGLAQTRAQGRGRSVAAGYGSVSWVVDAPV
jgi:hypothetical protein